MRDKLMHHYFGIDLKTIWKVINENIPKLKDDVKSILEEKRQSRQKIKNNLFK